MVRVRYRVYDPENDKWYMEDDVVVYDGYVFENFSAFENYTPLKSKLLEVYEVHTSELENGSKITSLTKIKTIRGVDNV